MNTLTDTRPKAHFTPPAGWLNDPNGLVFFEGEYHLFYQYHPDSLVWGPMHWGHAVSRDLVNWEHLDIALWPDDLGTCFSGCAVVDINNTSGLFPDKPGLVAIYTCHRDAPGFDRGYIEEQCIAYSHDNGRSWIKYAKNPVISTIGKSDFRDPKVFWHEASQHWVMSLAVSQEVHFYRSSNLLDWEFCSRFGEGHGAHTAHPWECPDLFQLQVEGTTEKRWVLVIGLGASEEAFGSFTQYFVGEFDGKNFINENPPETILLMDEGRDFYAAQSWSDAPEKQRLAIAWMSNWKYANQFPASSYRGSMSSARTLTLSQQRDGVRMKQQFSALTAPTNQLSSSVLINDTWCAETDTGARTGYAHLNLATGTSVELSFFDPASADLRVTLDESRYRFDILRASAQGEATFKGLFDHDYSCELPATGSLRLEWTTDQNSLEVLLGGGLMSITQLVTYSEAGAPLHIRRIEGECLLEEHAEALIA